MDWNRRDWVILAAVTGLAALLRLYQLGSVPPGFQFDEAFNALDARLVLAGNYPLFLPANGGREVLYTYWQALIGAVLGINVYSLRLASALAGLFTVPATYVMLRTMLRRQSRKVAGFTSVVLAISFWHIHFSHYAIRVIVMPLLLTGAVGSFWLGSHATTRTRRLLAFVVSGILIGLTPWTHPAGRLVPFVFILYCGWLLWRLPQYRRLSLDSPLGGLVLSGVAAMVIFLPLGWEFYRQPDLFFGHASEVSIFTDRVSHGSPGLLLLQNLLRVVGMFNVSGDVEWTHNLAGRPVFDLLLSIPFLIGIVLWFWRLRHRQDQDFEALSLLAIWVLIMLVPSILSEAAPNYSRTMPSLPATFVAAGLGLTWLTTLSKPTERFGYILVVIILTASTAQTVVDYFGRFAARSEVYYLFDADKLDALDFLSQYTDENQVYLSQLWGDKHATIYLLRGDANVGSVDTSDTVVLPPPTRGALYAFPAEQRERAERLAGKLPGAILVDVPDRLGHPLMTVVKWAADDAQNWPLNLAPDAHPATMSESASAAPIEARFEDSPTLLGMHADQETGVIWLFWRGDISSPRNLTAFMHLIDEDGRRVGQLDKLPGNGSYQTPYWTVGERVVERFAPEIGDPCVGDEEVQVLVGWYEAAGDNRRMPRSDAPGDTAVAGRMTLPIRSRPLTESPATGLVLAIDESLSLQGYELHNDIFQAGSPLLLDLYWLGGAADGAKPLALQLVGMDGSAMLWEGQIAPDADWIDGEVICRRLRARMPLDATVGDYVLQLDIGGQIQDVTAVILEPSTRLFTAPQHVEQSGIRYGDEIELSSFDIQIPDGNAEEALEVTLAWKTLSAPANAYKVFIHLVDQDGRIVTQSDAIPGGGYVSTDWAPGEYVIDSHELSLPVDLAPGTYRLLVGLYDSVSGQRLSAIDATGDTIESGAPEIAAVDLP